MRSMKIVTGFVIGLFALNLGASPADRRERRQERRENRQERREDRRDNRQERREDRRDARHDRRHDRREHLKDAAGSPGAPAAQPPA
ncbi:MAG: hypothetical protein K2X47_01220, partial [Bdellovibrionales bacterium]|nr:hypothetical protein [Bdellovibrionales bacterium]